MPINDSIKRLVRQRADCLCEYCHSLERLSANRFTIDHLIPRSIGGSDEFDNLALACRRWLVVVVMSVDTISRMD